MNRFGAGERDVTRRMEFLNNAPQRVRGTRKVPHARGEQASLLLHVYPMCMWGCIKRSEYMYEARCIVQTAKSAARARERSVAGVATCHVQSYMRDFREKRNWSLHGKRGCTYIRPVSKPYHCRLQKLQKTSKVDFSRFRFIINRFPFQDTGERSSQGERSGRTTA